MTLPKNYPLIAFVIMLVVLVVFGVGAVRNHTSEHACTKTQLSNGYVFRCQVPAGTYEDEVEYDFSAGQLSLRVYTDGAVDDH